MWRADFVKAMNEPFPEGGSISDLVHEMVLHADAPPQREGALVAMFQVAAPDVASFKDMSTAGVERLRVACSLLPVVMQKTMMLLGTMVEPHKPSPDTAPLVDDDGADDATPLAKKGGTLKNVGEVLIPRRSPITEYFPPSVFDPHRIGSSLRNENALKKLIPSEVCITGGHPDCLVPHSNTTPYSSR